MHLFLTDCGIIEEVDPRGVALAPGYTCETNTLYIPGPVRHLCEPGDRAVFLASPDDDETGAPIWTVVHVDTRGAWLFRGCIGPAPAPGLNPVKGSWESRVLDWRRAMVGQMLTLWETPPAQVMTVGGQSVRIPGVWPPV